MLERRHLLRLGLGAAASAGLGLAPDFGFAKPKGKAHAAAKHASGHARHAAAKEPIRPSVLASAKPRTLAFHHLHTGEDLDLVYWEKGDYVPDALAAVNKLLRDFRTDEVHEIDPRLLDLLCDIRTVTGATTPFRIISGFRSAATNEALRDTSAQAHGTSEVAKKSLHMEGQAIDLRLVDVSLVGLRKAATGLRRGGVGYYPDSDFVHVDVGAVRTWSGT